MGDVRYHKTKLGAIESAVYFIQRQQTDPKFYKYLMFIDSHTE